MKALAGTLLTPALIFVGAGVGGVLRFWIGGVVQQWWGSHHFPLGTMVVNVSGCLAIGFLVAALAGPVLLREDVRSLVLVGFLGGYTTFSTFGRETIALLLEGNWGRATAYVLLTNILCLGAVWLGVVAGRMVERATT